MQHDNRTGAKAWSGLLLSSSPEEASNEPHLNSGNRSALLEGFGHSGCATFTLSASKFNSTYE